MAPATTVDLSRNGLVRRREPREAVLTGPEAGAGEKHMATSSMAGTSPARIALIGFVAAAIAILIFHQGGFWTVAQALGSRSSAWAMAATKPLGVPALLSNMFWGGFTTPALGVLSTIT